MEGLVTDEVGAEGPLLAASVIKQAGVPVNYRVDSGELGISSFLHHLPLGTCYCYRGQRSIKWHEVSLWHPYP